MKWRSIRRSWGKLGPGRKAEARLGGVVRGWKVKKVRGGDKFETRPFRQTRSPATFWRLLGIARGNVPHFCIIFAFVSTTRLAREARGWRRCDGTARSSVSELSHGASWFLAELAMYSCDTRRRCFTILNVHASVCRSTLPVGIDAVTDTNGNENRSGYLIGP